MTSPIVLLTDRAAFAETWSQACGEAGLAARSGRPEELALLVEGASAVVVDAGAAAYDEDELLAAVGLVRGLGAIAAVALPEGDAFSEIADVLDDLCPGLVARSPADVRRVVAALGRRGDASRARSFEYVTVSPRAGELLAILADGTAVLVPRPVAQDDDGSEVSSIALADDAERATLSLVSGARVMLEASKVAHTNGARVHAAESSASNGGGAAIDGARLGARLRELRMAAGLTQAELARRTGIHRPNIARVEAGRHTPSLDTLARLASAIGVPTTRVLAEE